MGGGRRVVEVGPGLRGGRGKEERKKKSESAFSLLSGINLQADRADAATQGKC